MEERTFIEKLARLDKLFLENDELLTKRIGYKEQMEKDEMYGQLALNKEDMLIDKKSYLKNKIGNEIPLTKPTKKKYGFPLLIIGISLIILGMVTNFMVSGIGVLALLFAIKVFMCNRSYNKNNKLYEENKNNIENASQEYDKLKAKWLKIIREDSEKHSKNSDEIELLIPELWNYAKTLDLPTGLSDIKTLLILSKYIKQHDGKIDEAMDDCKEAIKKEITKEQCNNCARKDFCGERNSVYNCSNFVKTK